MVHYSPRNGRKHYGTIFTRQRHNDDLTTLRQRRHQQPDRLAQVAVEPRDLARVPRVDDAALALGLNDVVFDLGDDIAEPRLGMDGDRLTSGVSIGAAVSRAADSGNLRKVAPAEPDCEVELLSMFTITMDVASP